VQKNNAKRVEKQEKKVVKIICFTTFSSNCFYTCFIFKFE